MPMNSDQIIEFVARKRVTTFVETNAFRFEANPRLKGRAGKLHAWLQRKAWAFLHGAGALTMHKDRHDEYVRHVIDGQTFVDRFHAQTKALYQWTSSAARTLLIGGEDFDELMRSRAPIDQEFTFKATISMNHIQRPPTLYGEPAFVSEQLQLTVYVIPWMRGYVVLP